MKASASELQRIFACRASVLLPRVGLVNAVLTRGNWRHAYLEAVPKVGAEEALLLVPEEYREEVGRIDLDAIGDLLVPGSTAQEVAFMLDVLTGKAREVGRSIGRAYPERTRGEIAGTADIVAFMGADGVYVGDWKGVDPSTPHAEANLQMRFLALAACRAYGREHAVVELIHLKEDGTHYRTRAALDSLDLDAFEGELRELYLSVEEALVTGEVVEPVEGPHCRRCPAFSNCPAKARLARELAGSVETGENPAIDADNAPFILARLEAGEMLLRHVRERLEQYAAEHPFPTGKGPELFGQVEETTESPVAAKAGIALAQHFDAMCAQAALETKVCTSWDRINRAVSAWVKRQPKEQKLKVGETQALARKLLRGDDALAVKRYTRVKRFVPEIQTDALPAVESDTRLVPSAETPALQPEAS